MVTGIGGRDGRGGRDRHVVLLQDSGNEKASVKRSTTKESCPRRRKGGGGGVSRLERSEERDKGLKLNM